MKRKIFVSYKYADKSVRPIFGKQETSVRDYVDLLQNELILDHIFKGESDGEDLSDYTDEYIEKLLRDRMFDSSITVVMVSKNMKDHGRPERDQWIPWEIAYSLREKTRDNKTSRPNAMLCVILPDEHGNYDHFVQAYTCGCTKWYTKSKFQIIGDNMFNLLNPNTTQCTNCGDIHTGNNHSYMYPILWENFYQNIDHHLNIATQICDDIDSYKLVKEIRS